MPRKKEDTPPRGGSQHYDENHDEYHDDDHDEDHDDIPDVSENPIENEVITVHNPTAPNKTNPGGDISKSPSESNKTISVNSTNSDRTNTRSLEWTFFTDAGPYSNHGDNYRKAKCKSCAIIVRSKRPTLKSHILACTRISAAARKEYTQSAFSFRKNHASRSGASGTSIKNFFQTKIGKSQIMRIEAQLVRAAIATNTGLNSISNPEFLKAYKMLNPSFELSGRTALRTTVFDRVSQEERKKVKAVYDRGCYVSLSADGWVTPGHCKWFGICAILRSIDDGKSTIDARRFEDISLEGENEIVVARELKEEINVIQESIETGSKKSILGSVITDSFKPNISAKRKLASIFPNVLFLPCHAHQLNLLAGNILTHASTKSAVSLAIDLINFFHNHPKQKARLQDIVRKHTGNQLEFVQYGQTRWFSHYQMILRFFRAKPFLEEYKSSTTNDDPILKKKIGSNALDTIGATSFWSRLNLISELLRVIVIEIGNAEKRVAGFSDVVQSFGRIWAFLKNINTYQSHRFDCFPGLLDDMLQRWTWRLNIYYDVKLLILAHVLDPKLGMKGLNTANFDKRKVYNILQNVADKVDPQISRNAEKRNSLAREFVLYLQEISNESYSPPEHTDPFAYWSCHSELDLKSVSQLRQVAMFVFSAPASSADLERIWSSCLINLTTRRNRLKKRNVLKTIQIKTAITMNQESSNQLKQSIFHEKNAEKDNIAELLHPVEGGMSQSQQSQNTRPTNSNILSDSSSSDNELDDEVQGGGILAEIDSELMKENISEFAKNLLQDSDDLEDIASEVLNDSEVQAYLDGKQTTGSPKKKKRKMQGYRRVTQSFTGLFSFDEYLEFSEAYYYPNSTTTK